MHIAYLCVYQGPELLAQRPIKRGRSIAGSEKSRLVASAMSLAGHDVYCIAEAIPTDRTNKYYRAFNSTIEGYPSIRVIYPSGLDFKFLNNVWGRLSNYPRLWFEHRRKPFGAIVIYDLSIFQIFYVLFAHYILHVPVIIDYEDDGMVAMDGTISILNQISRLGLKTIRKIVNGCIAISPQLFVQFSSNCPQCLVRGVVDFDLIELAKQHKPKKQMVLFSGGLIPEKGIDLLLAAWPRARKSGWTLHISGAGPMAAACAAAAMADSSIVFHGEIGRRDYIELLCASAICVNPSRITATPGHIFPFKIVEYLASGAIIVSTRMCEFDKEMLPSIVFADSDTDNGLAAGIIKAMDLLAVPDNGERYAIETYGLPAVSKSIDTLLSAAINNYQNNRSA